MKKQITVMFEAPENCEGHVECDGHKESFTNMDEMNACIKRACMKCGCRM